MEDDDRVRVVLWVEWGWRAYPPFLIKSYSTVTQLCVRGEKTVKKREKSGQYFLQSWLRQSISAVMFPCSIKYHCVQNGGPVSLWAAGVICPNLISSRHLHIFGPAELWSSRRPCSNTEQHANPYDITAASSAFCLARLSKVSLAVSLKIYAERKSIGNLRNTAPT